MGSEPGPAATKHLSQSINHFSDGLIHLFLNLTSADSFKMLHNKIVLMCDTLVCDFGAIVNENSYCGCPI